MELTSESSFVQYNNDHAKTVDTYQALDPFVSDPTLYIVTYVLDVWMALIMSIFGVFSNALSLVVFVKLGFSDTVNITMTAITTWDLVRLLCAALHRLYGPICLFSEARGRSWQNMTTPTIVYFHVIASCASYVIGGYVALERCLCVIAPFKVKLIITQKVIIGVCVTISVVIFTTLFPLMLVFETAWVYSPQYGQFIAIYRYSEFYRIHGETYLAINRGLNFLFPTASLVIMIFSTVIISYHLRNSTKLRRNVTISAAIQGNSRNELVDKHRQVIKMLLVVIALYMVSLIPRIVHYTVILVVDGYFPFKPYNNIFWVGLAVYLFLDFVSSSGNLFILYSMSSKFRHCANATFCLQSFSSKMKKTTSNN